MHKINAKNALKNAVAKVKEVYASACESVSAALQVPSMAMSVA